MSGHSDDFPIQDIWMGIYRRVEGRVSHGHPVYEMPYRGGKDTHYLFYYDGTADGTTTKCWCTGIEIGTAKCIIYQMTGVSQPHLARPREWKGFKSKGNYQLAPDLKICCNDGACAARTCTCVCGWVGLRVQERAAGSPVG